MPYQVARVFLAKTLIFLLILVLSSAQNPIFERSALTGLKNALSDPYSLLSTWTGTNACAWQGVTCDSRFRVVAVNISGGDGKKKLGGKLPALIGNLTELRTLSIRFQSLSGEIPDEIWKLPKLEILNLEGNSVSGHLPMKFMQSLKVLNLKSNLFTGEVPHSISSCVELERLDLSNNKFNGTIPGVFGIFANLETLDLSFNQFTGSIPNEIGDGCGSLVNLDLSRNFLFGGIPRNFGNCSKIESLMLFSNLLDDVIPTELGKLSKLRVLDVSRNSLSGVIPAELGNCLELSDIILSNPYNPMPPLNDPDYNGIDDCNYFQGGISENITSLPKLRVFWAPRATLEGEISSNWGSCESLEMVNLGGNLFTGGIPNVFRKCENLKFLNLSSNKLTGWISEEVRVPCMSVFDVSGNQLSGVIPKFSYESCSKAQFSVDDLPFDYYSFFRYNSLVGVSLPYLDSRGDYVVYHNFGWNNFTGYIPSLPISAEILSKDTLYAFLADGNQLVGPLSDALFEKCKTLNGLIISFSHNLISGAIPDKIGDTCNSLFVFNIAGNRLTGVIPTNFGQLGNLVGLDLSGNRLQGEIPMSLANLTGLNYLSLGSNNLSGHIPPALEQLHALKRLDLSSNSFTGKIPSGLVNLKNLTALFLDNNKLSGEIPSGFANVASLSMFNVSYNNLSGPLPSNSSTMRCESVLGNPLLESCHVYSLSIPPSDQQGSLENAQPYTDAPPSPSSSSSGFSSIEIASIASASAIVSVLLALIVLYIYTRKCAPRSSIRSSGRREVTVFTDIGVPITYESVVRATGSFNASNCIGSGGFGATYKAEISPGVLVAIKRLSVGRFQGVQQFHAEIKTLGRWRHPNLVTLIGYHVSESEMFLIYNYLPGGNLERFIQERSKRAVDWRMLHKIAFDVARALAYLHDHCVPRILHRDVKPSNILLDKDFNAYLSDFGLARLLGNSETHATTGVAGTFGYVAPEYAMTCRVSDKADVYSYGVVLLELISDKKALDPSFSPYGNGFNIVAWACMLLRQGKAREFFTEGLWDVAPHDDLVETLHLAVMCTVDSLSIRPTMKQVVQRLKQLQPPTC